jgi:hypothetical protein
MDSLELVLTLLVKVVVVLDLKSFQTCSWSAGLPTTNLVVLEASIIKQGGSIAIQMYPV